MKIRVKFPCVTCDGEGFLEGDLPCGDCEDGLDTAELPARNEVCWRCDGNGKHCNPNIDGNGLTREDFEEDPDFRDDYFSGVYDVTCEECGGRNVIPVIDLDACNAEQKKLAEASERHEAQIAQWDREDAQTRRMESGGY